MLLGPVINAWVLKKKFLGLPKKTMLVSKIPHYPVIRKNSKVDHNNDPCNIV